MNKTFSKSDIIPPFELTFDDIVLNYCLLDITCFPCAVDNFIRVTNLYDRRLIVPNITAQLNQCHEKKNVNIHGEKTVKLAYMVDLLLRNHC